MKNIQLCSGDVYLKGYENCDIVGYVIDKNRNIAVNNDISFCGPTLDLSKGNPNLTTLDKYFKKPFEEDAKKRPPKVIIVDTIMNILEKWSWKTGSVDNIVMVNSFEHFTPENQIPHIISEAKRVLKKGGVFKFDFPDIRTILEEYYPNPLKHTLMMELIYGSRKNQFSQHEWGYTEESIKDFFHLKYWNVESKFVVTKDHPAIGIWATKK